MSLKTKVLVVRTITGGTGRTKERLCHNRAWKNKLRPRNQAIGRSSENCQACLGG